MCTSNKMSYTDKTSCRQNVLQTKRPADKTSCWKKRPADKTSCRQNVLLDKTSGGTKCPTDMLFLKWNIMELYMKKTTYSQIVIAFLCVFCSRGRFSLCIGQFVLCAVLSVVSVLSHMGRFKFCLFCNKKHTVSKYKNK